MICITRRNFFFAKRVKATHANTHIEYLRVAELVAYMMCKNDYIYLIDRYNIDLFLLEKQTSIFFRSHK